MTCATANCTYPALTGSKYCPAHKRIARQEWVKRMREGEIARAEREIKWADLYARAHSAGLEVAEQCIPAVMVVQQHENMMDDDSPVKQQWAVPEGVCGFAWVTVTPGNCSFALWLKKHHNASKGYHGGMELWVSDFGQSYERKHAYARAFARIVSEAGVKAYAGGRLD